MYKETQNLLKISDKTDGNFVQLHKHTQETEQCICLKKALQTSQGGHGVPCPYIYVFTFNLSALKFFHLSAFTFHFSHKKNENPYCLMLSQLLRCAQEYKVRVLCHTEHSEVSQFRAVAGRVCGLGFFTSFHFVQTCC